MSKECLSDHVKETIMLISALLAFGMIAVPLGAGMFMGKRLRSVRGASGVVPFWACALIFVVPVCGALLVPPYRTGLSPWDLVMGGVLFSTGLAGGLGDWLGRLARFGWAKSAAVALVSLLALETACRVLFTVPVYFPPPEEARLFFHTADGVPPDEEFKTRLAYPALFPGQDTGTSGGRPSVLHVGDSMVQGTGRARNASFTFTLSELDTGRHHVNLAVAGTGPDFYWLTAMNWSEVLLPEKVVFYIFLGNDLRDAGRSYAFCDNGPLYEDTDGGYRLRCLTPKYGGLSLRRLLTAPAPHAVRLATGFSAVARALAATPMLVLERFERWQDDGQGVDRVLRVLSAARKQLQAMGIGLHVVLLPYRRALENPATLGEQHRSLHEQLVAGCREMNVRVTDAWALFDNAEGRDLLFLNDIPEDVHFSVEGHRRLARWLLAQEGF